METSTHPTVQLARPGAGLPLPELFFARLLFAWRRRRGSQADHAAVFRQQRHDILALVHSCTPEQAETRVLIPRLRGLEDSSRFWSAWMTLDHLRITNHATAQVIVQLLQGKVPERVASTAAVKPTENVGADIVAEFEESCTAFEKATEGAPTLHTRVRYAHPWFGPLDAAGWHAMGGFHMRLHRRQIESILAGLPRR